MMIDQLPVLVLNPYGRCNCRCAMCDIWKNAEPQELHLTDIEAQLKSFNDLRVSWVVLSGGEALMHRDLWKITAALRARDIRITLLSSGLLLSREATRIVENIDDVIVSLDGPSAIHDAIRGVAGAFQSLARGVFDLRRMKPAFPVSGRCTVQKRNSEYLCDTADAARNIGLDSISFLAVDVGSGAFNRPGGGWPLRKQQDVSIPSGSLVRLGQEFRDLLARNSDGFVRETPEKLQRIVNHFRVIAGLESPVSPSCNAPWTSAVVEANGDVRPCFFHPPIGTIRSGLPLDAIMNGARANAFRADLDIATNPICQGCVCSLEWKGT